MNQEAVQKILEDFGLKKVKEGQREYWKLEQKGCWTIEVNDFFTKEIVVEASVKLKPKLQPLIDLEFGVDFANVSSEDVWCEPEIDIYELAKNIDELKLILEKFFKLTTINFKLDFSMKN